MLRRLSTGEIIDPALTEFLFPTGYHYDVLRALDYLRRQGPSGRAVPRPSTWSSRSATAMAVALENPHPDQLDLEMDEAEGEPSRWNTLRALRCWTGIQYKTNEAAAGKEQSSYPNWP